MRSFCQRGMPSDLPPAESPPWPLRRTLAKPKLLAMPRRPRSSEPVAELAARLADAAQAQQTLRAQLHRLRQRERTQRARSRSRWDAMVQFGVMVLTILGADFAWVPNLVSRFQQTADPEEVEEAITEAYLALTAEELEQMLAPHSRVSKGSAVSQAHAFATQFAVWKWVDETNCCTGLAPSVAEVVQRRNLCLDETEAGVWSEFTAAPSRNKAASYKWVARWRHSWDVAFGKASQRDVLPTETMRTKALMECLRPPKERRRIAWGIVLGGIPAEGGQTPIAQPGSCPEALHGFGGGLFLPPEFLFPEPSNPELSHGAGRPEIGPRINKTRSRNRSRFLAPILVPSCMMV